MSHRTRQPRRLPQQTVSGKLCYRDDRLREWRPVDDPHHPIPYGTAHPDKCLKCDKRETCDHEHEATANCAIVPGTTVLSVATCITETT